MVDGYVVRGVNDIRKQTFDQGMGTFRVIKKGEKKKKVVSSKILSLVEGSYLWADSKTQQKKKRTGQKACMLTIVA